MSLSKHFDYEKVFAKNPPGHVANEVFQKYLQQHHENNSCLERFLANWKWDKEVLFQIQKFCPSIRSLTSPHLPSSFLKSCKRQLFRLRKKFEDNPEAMVSIDGL